MMQKLNRNPDTNAALPEALVHAAGEAEKALEAIAPSRDQMIEVLERFEGEVRASGVHLEVEEGEAVRSAVEAFGTQYDQLREKLGGLAEDTSDRLEQGYAALQRDARFVTIMLFGRTKAGKSTTMEALTGGDGSTIGTGEQHFTRTTRAYYFPAPEGDEEPDYPCLRIVDTPGIDGFEGEELAMMAEDFVERSDHIFFLLSDDKAGTEELERFGAIRTQGKGVTALLNIKKTEQDLDLLVSAPELIFEPREIEGHQTRISEYLQGYFGMDSPEVYTFHADAAWRARASADHLAGLDRAELEEASRFGAIEERIHQFVTREAVLARRKAPRDLLNGYIVGLKDELRPFAGNFRSLADELERISMRFEKGTERARRQIARRFPQLRARFQAASDDIPQMVDGIISQKGGGRKLDAEWRKLLSVYGVSESVQWFVEAGRCDFIRELEEEVHVAATDFEASSARDLGGSLNDYYESHDTAKRGQFRRAALRTGAAAAASALTYWAVTNWWNPTGWIAAAGAAGAAGAAASGWGAQETARGVTNEWARIDKSDLMRRRSEIIKDLRERLWGDYRRARQECGEWLDNAKEGYRGVAMNTVRPVMKAARRLHRATTTTLDGLDEVADTLNSVYVQEIMRELVPEVADGHIEVTAVARKPGFATKIRVVPSGAEVVHPLGMCIGKRGRRVQELSNALGGEPIDFVDDNADPGEQVRQALGMRRLVPAMAENALRVDHGSKVTVLACGSEISRLIGSDGANVRLARKLLNMDIRIGEPA